MSRIFLAAAFLACSLVSCDKGRVLVKKTREALEAKISGSKLDNATDARLDKLVDRTDEGVRFRKDLPFPALLEVRTVRTLTLDIRQSEESALGREVAPLKSKRSVTTLLERAGDQVRYTHLGTTAVDPAKEGTEEKPAAEQQVTPQAKPLDFRKSGSGWKAAGPGNFRSAMLSQELGPFFSPLLIDNGLAPRTMWFGKTRFKVGDIVQVTGNLLPMVVAGDATGRLTLTLDSFEPINGHPCAVFLVSGNFTRPEFPDFEGVFSDMDVTIKSGKLWMSLLYPLILREELDTIQTVKSGNRGNSNTRIQGKIGVSVVRDWKIPSEKPAKS